MGRPKLNIKNRICKDCNKDKNIEEFTFSDNKTRKSCRECVNKKQVKYRSENKEHVRKIKKEWRKKNRDSVNKRCKEWRESLDEEQKEEQRIKRNEYLKNKRKNDPYVKIKEAMHRMLRRTLKRKTDRTSTLLGYSKTELKEHIESLFIDGMNWDNYGEWHIDHIRPISSFDIGTDPKIINSLDNLQPLWWMDNLSKGDKWID
tara:strand:- start:423 stop:1031 length:609 start_codon:yes stop_codon:yes gene_type:complete